jgi:hypothetical protein
MSPHGRHDGSVAGGRRGVPCWKVADSCGELRADRASKISINRRLTQLTYAANVASYVHIDRSMTEQRTTGSR